MEKFIILLILIISSLLYSDYFGNNEAGLNKVYSDYKTFIFTKSLRPNREYTVGVRP